MRFSDERGDLGDQPPALPRREPIFSPDEIVQRKRSFQLPCNQKAFPLNDPAALSQSYRLRRGKSSPPNCLQSPPLAGGRALPEQSLGPSAQGSMAKVLDPNDRRTFDPQHSAIGCGADDFSVAPAAAAGRKDPLLMVASDAPADPMEAPLNPIMTLRVIGH
jgi:hypothetical protein